MKTSEQTDKVLKAVFAVKKELVAVSKSADNPFYKSKYADLNTHLDEIEPRLEKAGCMLLQPVNNDNTVESRIIHVESGQWISSEMQLIVSKNTMQDAGSAVTYARRYTVGALLSIKAEDDDGEKALGRGYQATKATPQATKATPQAIPQATAKTTPVTTLAEAKEKFENETDVPVAASSTPPSTGSFKKTSSFRKTAPKAAAKPVVQSTETSQEEWS